jgi:hypothetical protein
VKMLEKKDIRLSVLLVLVLFVAQIFVPFVVAQAQSEDKYLCHLWLHRHSRKITIRRQWREI